MTGNESHHQLKHQQSAPAGLSTALLSTSSSLVDASATTAATFGYLKDREEFRTNCLVKPPYSYSQLIILSMKESTHLKMTLQMIYDWIIENFSYFKKADPSWQITFKNSIRHNLSLNKCFKKIARQKDEPGKGGFWTLDPEFEKQLDESNAANNSLLRSNSVACANTSVDSAFNTSADGSSMPLSSPGGTALKSNLFNFKRRRNNTKANNKHNKGSGGGDSSATLSVAVLTEKSAEESSPNSTITFTSNATPINTTTTNPSNTTNMDTNSQSKSYVLQKCTLLSGPGVKEGDQEASSVGDSIQNDSCNNNTNAVNANSKKFKSSSSASSPCPSSSSNIILFSPTLNQSHSQQNANNNYFNSNNSNNTNSSSTCSNCNNCNSSNINANSKSQTNMNENQMSQMFNGGSACLIDTR